jgi:hypothetical protein
MNNIYTCIITVLIPFVLVSCKQPVGSNGADQVDICIYGGTSAGVIAAYAAKMLGKSVILIEPGNRLGGLSSGGLGQTDIGNKHAVTGLSRDFYRRLGNYYGTFEQWRFEPNAALQVFNQYVKEGDITVLYFKRIIAADVKGKTIRKITIEDSRETSTDKNHDIYARMFIDCSYEGDLMALAGVSYTVGRESNDVYDETINGVQLRELHQFPDSVDPYIIVGEPTSGLLWGISDEDLQPTGTGDKKVQAYNFRICLTDSVENMVPIIRPENYDSTKYELLLRLMEARNNNLYSYFIWSRMPNRKTDINNSGGFSTDMIGMNWEYPEASYVEREKIFQDHLDYTKGLLYFWGHDPRVPESAREEMLKWGYPKDEYEDNNHFSPQLYVREARRMVGEYVMTEHHCRGDSVVSDPIGLAAYTMDSHNCQRLVVNNMVKNEGDVEVGGFPPYPISYRSLVPKTEECTNLLVPVCLSASHIAFGSIRMEPVFMVLGQVSALAASMAIDEKQAVQKVDVNELREIMETDPLLDGTPADIIVDDADEDCIVTSGKWETQSRYARTYNTSLLYSTDTDSEEVNVKFMLTVLSKGLYKVYYYCPQVRGRNMELPGKLNLIIHHSGGEEQKTINYLENVGDWAFAGDYNFDAGSKHYIQLYTKNSDLPYIADAVLLVPDIDD